MPFLKEHVSSYLEDVLVDAERLVCEEAVFILQLVSMMQRLTATVRPKMTSAFALAQGTSPPRDLKRCRRPDLSSVRG